MGLRVPPFAFTEHGVIMLASVLSSERAIYVNLKIVRVFIHMREMLQTHRDILLKLDEIERKYSDHDQKIKLIFEYLKQLEESKEQESEQKNRKRIGFKAAES